MLNNSMAELGCDRPEVILKLDRNQVPAGEELIGSFLVWREFVKRTDNTIDVDFVLRAQLEDEVIEQKIDEFQTDLLWIAEDTQIAEFPFSYRLPKWLPVSTHATRYYLKPKLFLDSVSTRCGEEYVGMEAIIIQPNQDQVRLMKALAELGFQEKLDSRFWNGKFQEFDFVAGKGSNTEIQELTVLFHPDNDTVRVDLYADQRKPVSFVLSKEQDVAASLGKSLQLR